MYLQVAAARKTQKKNANLQKKQNIHLYTKTPGKFEFSENVEDYTIP